jgi:hypothetical protein
LSVLSAATMTLRSPDSDHEIAGFGIGDLHFILPAGAAPAVNGEAQPGLGGFCLAGEELAEFFSGFGSESDHVGRGNLGWFSAI